MAASYNFTIPKSTDFELDLTWKGSDKQPVDLTNWTAKMQIRSIAGGDLYIDLTTENNGIALGGTAGTIHIHIDHTVTGDIDWEKGVYDLHMISPGDIRSVLLSGACEVKETVTA